MRRYDLVTQVQIACTIAAVGGVPLMGYFIFDIYESLERETRILVGLPFMCWLIIDVYLCLRREVGR